MAQLSSRVDPHPWRATFTYSFGGDLYRRAENVLAAYYDAMLYLANWGSRQLMFRFPRAIVDLDQMRQYNVETVDPPSDIIQVHRTLLILTDSVVDVRSSVLGRKQAFLRVNFDAKWYEAESLTTFPANLGNFCAGEAAHFSKKPSERPNHRKR